MTDDDDSIPIPITRSNERGYRYEPKTSLPDYNFSDAPLSVAEVRANREHSGAKWTVRDALIAALRDIDSGKADYSHCFIALGYRCPSGESAGTFYSAGADPQKIVGTIEIAKSRFMRDSNGDE